MMEGTLFIQILTIYLILLVIIAPLWAMIDHNLQNAQLLKKGREAKKSLQNLTDMVSMTNSFIFYLKDGKYLIFPDHFFEQTHLRNRPISLSCITRCMSKADGDKLMSAIMSRKSEGEKFNCDFHIPVTGTKHSLSITINNVTDEFGETTCIGLFMLMDITRELEEQRREALHMEEDANVKASFLASMGHEIRTPLNAIVGFSQIITSQYEFLSAEDKKGFFDIIKQNNDQLLGLLDSVTLAANTEGDNLKLVLSKKRVSDLMEEIYLSHTVIVPKHLKLIYNRGNENDFVLTNRSSMLQVISNLMNNAIKFTNEGSITLGWESDEEHVTFYVEDTGIGIREENIDNVFSKFFKESYTSRGAGFGLPLCKRLVDKMNGKIRVKSTFGQGSRFEVILDKVKN